MADATAYVKNSADVCVLGNLSPLRDQIETLLVTAELAASKDPDKLVADDKIAEAFNFMSDEFRVDHPVHMTASDVLLYRSVMASVFSTPI